MLSWIAGRLLPHRRVICCMCVVVFVRLCVCVCVYLFLSIGDGEHYYCIDTYTVCLYAPFVAGQTVDKLDVILRTPPYVSLSKAVAKSS